MGNTSAFRSPLSINFQSRDYTYRSSFFIDPPLLSSTMSSIPSATSISNSSPDFDALDGYAQANPTSRRPDPAQQARSSSPSEDGQGFGEKRSAREEGFESLGTRAGLRSREGPGRKRRNVERELEGGSRVPLVSSQSSKLVILGGRMQTRYQIIFIMGLTGPPSDF